MPEPSDFELEIEDLDPVPVLERPWPAEPLRAIWLQLLVITRASLRVLTARLPRPDSSRNGRVR
jgi:hypothetical protein